MRYDARPIAIVGASAISGLGHDWQGLGQALGRGQTAVGETAQLASFTPAVLGAEVRDIGKPETPVERNARKLMSRGALLGSLAVRAAVHQAVQSGGWTPPHHEVAYYLAVGASGGDLAQLEAMLEVSLAPDPTTSEQTALAFSLERFGTHGLKRCNPLFAFQLMNNFTLCHGAMLEDIRGPNAALFSRGGGTVAALIEAAHAIDSGLAPRALAGGADSALHPVTYRELLDQGFSGLMPGEGAALLALDATGATDAPDTIILGFLEMCALLPDATRIMLSPAPADLPVDLIVLAPWGPSARERLTRFAAERHPRATIVDISAGLGESLAATPALAWASALDLLHAGHAERALVVSAGVDGDIGVVQLCAARASRSRPRSGSVRQHQDRYTPVITGVGVVSAFGLGAERFWDALAAGESAIAPITCFDARTLPTRVAGQLSDTDHAALMASLAGRLPGRLAPGDERDRKLPFGLHAALEAWQHAACGAEQRHAFTCLALGLEQALLEDFASVFDLGDMGGARIDWQRAARIADIQPGVRYRTPVNACERAIRRELGLTGPSVVHVSACAAGALSLAHAASLIARGQASTVLSGAADSMLNPLGLGGMSRLGAPSPRDQPDACRPFDRRRDGLVMGEGAAVLVVESLAQARARGIRPLARILGWGSTQDAYKATAPRPDGSAAVRAMRAALRCARLSPGDIDYINAHGTGTPLNDVTEANAIAEVLGAAAARVPMSSIKGAIGHLMAASGAIELAACLLPFTRAMLPGTAHLDELDPECLRTGPLHVLRAPTRADDVDIVLSNSFGFGGQNATVILGKYTT